MSFETDGAIIQKTLQCVGEFSFLELIDVGEGWLHPPQTPRKQVSHLHIVEGALPLTEIAFAILLSLFGFLFDVCCSLYDLVF